MIGSGSGRCRWRKEEDALATEMAGPVRDPGLMNLRNGETVNYRIQIGKKKCITVTLIICIYHVVNAKCDWSGWLVLHILSPERERR